MAIGEKKKKKLKKFTCRIHKDLRQTVDLCQKAESAGVSWITVHGRTAEERHQPVHYDAIKTIKDSVSVPVIANGDIKYFRDVQSIYQLTGVDGKLKNLNFLQLFVKQFRFITFVFFFFKGWWLLEDC